MEEETTFQDGFEFFMILLPNSLKKLRLPGKFAKVLDGREPRAVKLREAGCQHRLWEVEVEFDADGHMFLGRGWKQFANTHDLRLGDLLVLSYDDGHAMLTLKVFDGSMCRKHYQQDDDAKENPSEDESVELNDLHMPSKDYVLSRKCDLTVAHEAKIQTLVGKIQPEIPVLVAQMKKSNMYQGRGTLGIPKDYALKYLPCENTSIILQLPRKNKSWMCKLHIRPSGVSNAGRRSLYIGNFVYDTHVREGDIYLLQPMTNVKHKRFILTIHLLQKEIIAHSPSGRTNIDLNRASTSAKMGGVKEEPPTDGEEYSSENEEYEVSDDSKGASETLFMLADRACLTSTQEMKLLDKVEEIMFKPPFYVAIMSKSTVFQRGSRRSAKLNIGSQYANRYLVQKFAAGHHRGENSPISLVLQREGKGISWPTKLAWRLRHRSHEFMITKGWSAFARDNCLRVGDLVLFKLMKKREPLTMMVYIVRH